MLDLVVAPASLALHRRSGGGPPPSPPFAVDVMVIEGDSITSATPDQPSGRDAFYAYVYADDPANAGIAIHVRGQGSRAVGAEANLDDDGNTLMGNVAEDAAFEPDLVTTLIGANDMGLSPVATYRTNLIAYFNALKDAAPHARLAWSPPLPYNASGTPHPQYAYFTAQRAALIADCRDPAVWGQWADYYLPLGEHPDFADPSLMPTLYGDTVHPSSFDVAEGTGGQNRLYEVFKAAVDTIRDQSRAGSTNPYESVWPTDETHLATASVRTRRFVVSGIAHGGLAGGVAVSGGGAQVRLNGGAYGSSTGRIYNGDVVDLRITTSASASTAVEANLTIGSETRAIRFTTAAAVPDVAYVHGDIATFEGGGATHVFPGQALAAGVPVAFFHSDTAATAISLTPSGGGSPVALTKRAFVVGWDEFEIWSGPAIAAGSYAATVSHASWCYSSVLACGVVQGADPAPIQASVRDTGYDSTPHRTEAMTVPAHGLALVALGESAGGASFAPASLASPAVLVDEGQVPGQSAASSRGIALGTLAVSGQASFSFTFGRFGVGGIVFKALGT